jgi:quinol monooxygenase YgiN
MFRRETRIVLENGARSEFLRVAWAYMNLTRREAGCVRAEIYETIGKSNWYVFDELYLDKKAFEGHLSTEHTRLLTQFLEQNSAEPVRHESLRSVLHAPWKWVPARGGACAWRAAFERRAR